MEYWISKQSHVYSEERKHGQSRKYYVADAQVIKVSILHKTKDGRKSEGSSLTLLIKAMERDYNMIYDNHNIANNFKSNFKK